MSVEGKSVYIWGKGASGSLDFAQPPSNEETEPNISKLLIRNEVSSIKQVSCGVGFSAILSGDGHVYTFGNTKWYSNTGVDNPKNLKKWDAISSVIQIECGEAFVVALTESGQVYTWGTGTSGQLGIGELDPENHPGDKLNTPTLLESLTDICQISAGMDTAAALSKSGELYTWGKGYCGSLGHGNEESSFSPKAVVGLNPTQVKCGATHMAALTENGTIYTWGNNFLGPLGRILEQGKDSDFMPHPIELVQTGPTVSEENLKNASDIQFTQIECLKYNTLALSDQGVVFSCGKGGMDGGGHGDSPHTLFCIVEALKDIKVKTIARTKTSHAACITEEGQVFIWGSGECGQLGFGNTDNEPLPAQLKSLDEKHITQIACGENHTIALSGDEPSQEVIDEAMAEEPEPESEPEPSSESKSEKQGETSDPPETKAELDSESQPNTPSEPEKPESSDQSETNDTSESKPEQPSSTSESAKDSEEKEQDDNEEDSDTPVATIPIEDDAAKNTEQNSSSQTSTSQARVTGWLKKKGAKGIYKSWKRRFFVMEGDRISYYEKEDSTTPKGHIDIPDIIHVLEGGGKNAFNVVSRTKRVYELQAESPEDYSKWTEAITKKITQ
eukprot:gb/GECH01008842.1/.p1 GENE.gb/GECH01008842.1/~~gb/GECH01008842.1/.p1  ORF type:complete len:616 (+),score=180.08 gb/GECH01008842.1/:1-1848(+)